MSLDLAPDGSDAGRGCGLAEAEAGLSAAAPAHAGPDLLPSPPGGTPSKRPVAPPSTSARLAQLATASPPPAPAGTTPHHPIRHRFPRPPPLPPAARFTQSGLFGAFTDPAVEAAFWAARTPALRARDAAGCALFGVYLVGGIFSHQANFAPAARPVVLAVLAAAAAAGWRIRGSTGPRRPVAIRLATAICTSILVALHRADAPWAFIVRGGGGGGDGSGAVTPAVGAPPPAGLSSASSASPAQLLRAPAVSVMAGLALVCDGPPTAHVMTSLASLLACVPNLRRLLSLRVAMHGLAPHTRLADWASAVTHALLRPHEPGPRAMDPARAVLWLTLGLYCVVGFVLPTHILWASHRVARRRFRDRWEPVFGQGGVDGDGEGGESAEEADVLSVPAGPRRGPPLRRRALDSAVLDVAIQVGLWVGLWAAVEEVDGWFSP